MQHKTVTSFLNYLANEKKSSANTIESYRRDILSFIAYMDEQLRRIRLRRLRTPFRSTRHI